MIEYGIKQTQVRGRPVKDEDVVLTSQAEAFASPDGVVRLVINDKKMYWSSAHPIQHDTGNFQHKDVLGRDIRPGMIVAISTTETSGVGIGYVVKLTAQKVSVQNLKGGSYWGAEISSKEPGKLMVIPDVVAWE